VAIFLLKAFDAKFWGVVVMGGSVIILFFLPWLDHSEVKSIRYRPSWHKYVYGVFVFFFLILGYLGIQPPGVWGEPGHRLLRSTSPRPSRRSARSSTSASSSDALVEPQGRIQARARARGLRRALRRDTRSARA
jgi:thiol:disulfide interchange protein